MYVIGRLLMSLGWFIDKIFLIVYFALIIRIIISWVGADPYNEFVQIIFKVTEPILRPFRRLPLQFGGIDLSPIVAFLVLSLVRDLVVNIFYQAGFYFIR